VPTEFDNAARSFESDPKTVSSKAVRKLDNKINGRGKGRNNNTVERLCSISKKDWTVDELCSQFDQGLCEFSPNPKSSFKDEKLSFDGDCQGT